MRATMIQLGILHRNCEAKLNHIFKHLMQFFRNDLKFKRSMRDSQRKTQFFRQCQFYLLYYRTNHPEVFFKNTVL